MLLNRRLGSYLFLGALLVDLELQADAAHESAHCGTCTACLDACPTQAFLGPGVLDARRCISYLNIEVRGPIATEMRDRLEGWLFGCDVCQEVCPWNRKAPATSEPAFTSRPDLETIDLVELLSLSKEQFRARFRGTPLLRAGRTGLLRTAALLLGARAAAGKVTEEALRRAAEDGDPVVREAARWALERVLQKPGQGNVTQSPLA
jgi:epoxyqueuosine reductase